MKTTARPAVVARFERRISNQERRIAQGEKSGSLTKEEAAPLQARLDAMKSLVKDGFEGAAAPGFKKVFDGLSQDIRSAKRNEVTDPAARSTNIEQRLAAGLKDGSLTQAEHDALKTSADGLKAELAQALTPEAKKAVAGKLEALSKNVFKERHDGELDAGKRIESFANRVSAGLDDKSLNTREATRLAERVGSLYADSLTGKLDAKEVNQLNRANYRQRHDRQVG